MAELSAHAKRILDYLTDAADPMQRRESPIRDALNLNRHDLLTALDALEREGLIERRELWYDVTDGGWEWVRKTASEASAAGGETLTVHGDHLSGQARKIDTGGGDYVEGRKVSAEGGGVAAGGDLNVGQGGTVAGRDSIRIDGNVGPGSVVGSGSVKAKQIAGGNIGASAGGDVRSERAALRKQLGYLHEDLDLIKDEGVRVQAGRWLDRLEQALGLADPFEFDPGTIKTATDWLAEHMPTLAASVRGILNTPGIKRLLE